MDQIGFDPGCAEPQPSLVNPTLRTRRLAALLENLMFAPFPPSLALRARHQISG